MATTTTNLGMTLNSGEELFDTDTVMDNFQKIDTSVGNLANLSTTNKDSLVDAINEQNVNIEKCPFIDNQNTPNVDIIYCKNTILVIRYGDGTTDTGNIIECYSMDWKTMYWKIPIL